MKKVLFVSIAALIFAACGKKDVGTPKPGDSTPLVKTISESLSIVDYEYDAQGRIVKRKNSSGSRAELTYAPGFATQSVYDVNGNFQYSYTYEIGAQGKVVKTTLSTNANYVVQDQYNSDGTISKSISHINGSSQGVDYFYSNGNCDSLRYINSSGDWYLTVKKTFYTNQANVLGDQNYGYTFYSKQNKNLLKSEEYTYANTSSLPVTNYTYEFDAQGRVVKLTSTKGANIDILLFTY